MGHEIFCIFVMLVALPAVSVGFYLHYRVKDEQKGQLETAWERLGRSRGYTFVPAEGEWPNATAARLEWTERSGSRQRLEIVLREGTTCTRLLSRPTSLLLGQVIVSTLDKNRTLSAASTGDAAFDRVLFVRERPQGFSARVLSVEVRRRLAAFRMGGYVALRYRRGDLSLVWEGGEANPARIDEARALLSLAAEEVERSFHAASTRMAVTSASAE